MAERVRKAAIHEHDGIYKHRSAITSSGVGLDLGEIRQLIEACEGLPDSALVFASKLSQRDEDTSKYWVKEIHVQYTQASS